VASCCHKKPVSFRSVKCTVEKVQKFLNRRPLVLFVLFCFYLPSKGKFSHFYTEHLLLPLSFIMEQKCEVNPQPQVTLKLTSQNITETTKIAWKLPNFRRIVESSEDLKELSESVELNFETGKSVSNKETQN
jgi:hypothetical protein